MSVLICKFASARSRPDKIQRWIAYLDEVETRAQARSADPELVHRLRSEAERWLVEGSSNC